MRSSVETLDDNRVKLTVVLDEAEFDAEVDAAFKRAAGEVRIPGFRPGRAPRRLLEARLGTSYGRSEALRSLLPDSYLRAVVEHGLDTIDSPDIEVTDGVASGPVTFDAVVEVRPSVIVSGYDRLRVDVPSPAVEQSEIDAEIEVFLGQFADLSPVTRSAVEGDHLTVDISGALGGESVDGLTASDYDYRLGTGAVVPEIDENLRGARAGDILEFAARHPDADEDRPLTFKVLVKEVQEPVLPELDDEFVSANTEHSTVEDFRLSLHDMRSRGRLFGVVQARQQGIREALASLVADDPPEVLVKSRFEARVQGLGESADRAGRDLEGFCEMMGRRLPDVLEETKRIAVTDVKADLALRAVAAAEGLEADDDAVEADLRRWIEARTQLEADGADGATDGFELPRAPGKAADGAGGDPAAEAARLREVFASDGTLSEMRSELSKQAALEWITERVELVDPSGAVVDPALLKSLEPAEPSASARSASSARAADDDAAGADRLEGDR